jgi:hypothetical protein
LTSARFERVSEFCWSPKSQADVVASDPLRKAGRKTPASVSAS